MSEEQIYTILQQLAQQLQTTVEHLWGVLVRQAYVEGFALLVFYIIFILFILFFRNRFNEWNKTGAEGEWYIGISAVTLFIMTAIAVNNFMTLFTALFNPEYWALQRILEVLGGG